MRACQNCGHLCEDSANFCNQCGERLRDEPPPPPVQLPDEDSREPRSAPPAWLLILGAVCIIALVAVGAVLVLNDPEDGGTAPEDTASAQPTPTPAPTTATVPDPEDVLANTERVDVRLSVANCPDCIITAVPADDSGEQVATVSDGAVLFGLAGSSTLGLAFTVEHPDGFGESSGSNAVVLAPVGTPPGSTVPVSDVIGAAGSEMCWGGTTGTTGDIAIVVEPFGDGTPQGGLRAWADPAQPVLPAAVQPAADGSVEGIELVVCTAARSQLPDAG